MNITLTHYPYPPHAFRLHLLGYFYRARDISLNVPRNRDLVACFQAQIKQTVNSLSPHHLLFRKA